MHGNATSAINSIGKPRLVVRNVQILNKIDPARLQSIEKQLGK
jgi:hypothetical protein